MIKMSHFFSKSILVLGLAACQVGIPSPMKPSKTPVASSVPSPGMSVSPSLLSSPTASPDIKPPSNSPTVSASAKSTSSPPQNGLEAYYAFEGNANSQDRKHDGRLTQGMLFDAGIKGKAAYYLESPIETVGIYVDDLPVKLNRTFAISIWSRISLLRLNAGSLPLLCTTDLKADRFGLFWTPGGAEVVFNKRQSDEFLLHREKTPRPEVQKDEWHHTVINYDGQMLKIYLDGKLDLTAPYSSALQDYGLVQEVGVCAAVVPYQDPFRFFSYTGLIDELRIYSRVLTDAEVQALYQFDKGGTP